MTKNLVDKAKNDLLKALIKFYDTTLDALSAIRKGHNDGWDKLQKEIDRIEDDFCIDEFR